MTTSKNGTPAIWECESHSSVVIIIITASIHILMSTVECLNSGCNQVFDDFSEECVKRKCEYYFNVDSVAHIDNPHTLKLLVEQNRPVVAPLMIRPYQAWSNFWGSLTSDGFYARSIDYMEIVQNKRRSVNIYCHSNHRFNVN